MRINMHGNMPDVNTRTVGVSLPLELVARILQLMRETFNSVYTYTVVNVSYRTGVSIMGGSVRHLADRVKAEAGDLSEEVERAQGMMEQLKKEKEG